MTSAASTSSPSTKIHVAAPHTRGSPGNVNSTPAATTVTAAKTRVSMFIDASLRTTVMFLYPSNRPGAEEPSWAGAYARSEEHTSELQSREKLVCRLLLEQQ